ncbi:hypothetical protein AGDE_11308 [Angomonas deanei]|uniref:Zinc finger C-x8-C-x5-C-x3-H type (And similar)/CCCH-type zinc finger containing protein, putative n=1 Tax=Angomonas deanei TaxID=59799 RepID=A0A7G2CPI6_9TRYP|nr:hypothetical protein AGDE_11308 [Angomonas deanei]CAD2220092.1 Zinc finger C-x8-C-x5-C-x3-H type (and similar)/CCCH-type zinc finger containing protein, putative [Angomonas deanei]|eukprot:EPY26454.1 hypothetical protein AGDE_11308 [Angomonas deanei]
MNGKWEKPEPVEEEAPPAVVPTKKKKKKKNKTKGLYDLYLADSGSDSPADVEDEENITFLNEVYTVDMDINILINQTVQNIVQSVCLEGDDTFITFGDFELNCFVAAVKHNSSILSLQIRYLNVGDESLVPLCKALVHHPCIRALDLSGTQGSDATSRALRMLVCNNSNIIFARLDDSVCNARDREIIEKACKFNAFVCADPNSNPFQLGLLRKISAIEEKDHKLQEQLQARPWLLEDPRNKDEDQQKKTKKKVTIVAKKGNIGAEVCTQFVAGRCAYGSRCKYIHPERTVALKNAVASSQYNAENNISDTVSSAGYSTFSTASSTRSRLQSRLRPTNFTYRPDLFYKDAAGDASGDSDIEEDDEDEGASSALVAASLWTTTVVVACCCALVGFLG